MRQPLSIEASLRSTTSIFPGCRTRPTTRVFLLTPPLGLCRAIWDIDLNTPAAVIVPRCRGGLTRTRSAAAHSCSFQQRTLPAAEHWEPQNRAWFVFSVAILTWTAVHSGRVRFPGSMEQPISLTRLVWRTFTGVLGPTTLWLVPGTQCRLLPATSTSPLSRLGRPTMKCWCRPILRTWSGFHPSLGSDSALIRGPVSVLSRLRTKSTPPAQWFRSSLCERTHSIPTWTSM